MIEDLKDDAMARANDATKAAPVWVQDKQANECPYCHAEFTFINRRHHCRQCGKVVCNKCSTGREVLMNIDDTELQRICDDCMRRCFRPDWVGNAITQQKEVAPQTGSMTTVIEQLNPIMDSNSEEEDVCESSSD